MPASATSVSRRRGKVGRNFVRTGISRVRMSGKCVGNSFLRGFVSMRAKNFPLVVLLVGVVVAVASSKASADTISEPNLLTGMVANVSDSYNPDAMGPKNLTDGTTDAFAFGGNDNVRAIAFSNIRADVHLVRLWRGADLIPSSVDVYGSTSNMGGSLDTAGYTLLSSVPSLTFSPNWTADIAIHAEGVRSLLFKVGVTTDYGGVKFSELGEIQAFATPEPSTATVLVTGMVGLLAYAWRKRK